ncbi:MAG: glycoside hydrolase family 28 protein [Candidatus Gastranaerophilales bacterium]|nr:glycoside hydrolase family 28 protein [Candidatus Gastranaerophilales bacterium]
MAIYNITDYGAVPDSGMACTQAIQRAIDLCDKNGTVYIPKGRFLSGAVFLKSDMTLFLEEGARLVGTGKLEDFPLMGYPYEGLDQLCYASLINTDGAPHRNITIDGKGVIDANGVALFHAEMDENRGKRGRAVCIRNTENVTIKNVTLRQSPAWCLHLIYCRNVLIEGIEVHSKYDENGNKYAIFNCDGIDIDSCKDVRITRSLIASQDDCIAVKSGRNEEGRRVGIPSENIVIENCVFKSGFGVAMGSEMSGGVRDVFVQNCTFENTHSIVSIKTVRGRGAYIRNIHYENCSLVNKSTEYQDTKWFRGAIYIDGFYGEEKFDADQPTEVDEGTPVVDGIFLENITLDTVAGNAVYLYGLPEMPFQNITLKDVKAHGQYGLKVKNIENLQLIHTDIRGDED